MKSIDTLISDIQDLVTRKDGWFDEQISKALSEAISGSLKRRFNEPSQKPSLRLSGMGPKCPKALWYSIHHPELGEKLPPWAEVKYTFGDILEALGIALCKAAGHDVRGEQDELFLDGIRGHRDAVVDGCVVDFKSCSSRAFDKLKNKLLKQDDSFGYLDQLDGYVVASADDPLVTVKDKGYIFGIDKTLGRMVLYEHRVRPEEIRRRIRAYKAIVELPEHPACECGTVAEGRSGNIRLDTKASYNLYKFCCKPSIRTFLYASGPVYLTHVARRPDVPEVDRQGRILYN